MSEPTNAQVLQAKLLELAAGWDRNRETFKSESIGCTTCAKSTLKTCAEQLRALALEELGGGNADDS